MGSDGRVISASSGFDSSVSFGEENGVPGLGFDYPHLAAISGGIDNNRFGSNHQGEHNHANSVFVPFFFGGLPYYENNFDSGDTSIPAPQQEFAPQSSPQIIVIQQPVPQLVPQALAPQLAPSSAPSAAPLAQNAAPTSTEPPHDYSGYVLVLGSGRIVFASAYSVTGNQLHYVTPEGIRHSLLVKDVDASATQAMNEARGVSIQIQN
jgi:hypothetical protein